jgi:predicted transport protein
VSRRRHIGDLGERWTVGLLHAAGFHSVRDLNAIKHNHPGGDFLAERNDKLYFITVKARNKFVQGARRLNGGYNIYPEKVRRAAREYQAIPAWTTIQIDVENRCYSAYFGTIDELRNPNAVGVPMSLHAVSLYECLASDTPDPAITRELSNQIAEVPVPQREIGEEPAELVSGRAGTRPKGSAGKRHNAFVSFEEHIAYADPEIRPVLRQLRAKLVSLGGGTRAVREKVTKHQRVAYSVAQIFAEVKVQKKRILIRFFGTNQADPRRLVTSIPVTHGWQHDKEIAVSSPDLLDYALPFIDASFRSNRSTLPAR